MRLLCPLAATGLLLVLAGCSRPKVESYRIPKEKEPDFAAAAQAAPFAANGGGSMANTEVAVAAGPSLIWKAPADWQVKAASAMRKGSYAVPAAGGQADLSITAFPGDVGGELANVNRWRGQVQLAPVDAQSLDASVTRAAHHGLKFTVVDLHGSSSQAILGAIVPYNDGTWFFKLMGPANVVAKAKPEFLAFLQTVAPSAAP